MKVYRVDREHPPLRIEHRSADHVFTLRPWSFCDLDAMIEAVTASVEEIGAFMPWAYAPLTRDGQFDLVRRFHENYWAGRDYVMGIFDSAGAIVGGMGLHPRTPLNPRALEVGYWAASSRAGKGQTTAAARASIALAFDVFGCDRMQVMHDEANVASRRVVEKCGFVFEGTMRNVTAAVDESVVLRGYRGTRRNRMYALVIDDLPTLPWLQQTRNAMTIYDALGGEHRIG